ncbi:MAG: hypothetical protein H7Y86_01690 [Rhizobacter sp.]|nr:hypothetical protein [Ferruginibacter sp.]
MRFNFLRQAAVVISLPVIFSSCATIFGKSSYPFRISTDPAGAEVSVTNKKGKEIFKGASPANITLKSGAGYFSRSEYQVKISSTGYAEQVIPVNFKMNGWYFGNILLGGVIGMLIIDPISGAMWKLETADINATLVKTNSAALAVPTLNIIDIKDVPENRKADLIKIK